MPISALVLTLNHDPKHQATALDALAQEPRLELGELVGLRLPLAAETATLSEGRQLCQDLLELPGVTLVDLISVNFEDSEL